MSDAETGSLAEWLMSGEPPKTHEQRVWWHEYKTHDGIKEHAERIASLEELVLEIWRSCPVSEDECKKCPHHIGESDEDWCDIPIRIEELGIEVDDA